MINIKKKLVAGLLVLLTSLGFAGNTELAQRLDRFRSMEARFEQRVVDANGKPTKTVVGRMLLERPGKLFWASEKPTRQQVIARDETVWIYDIDLEQVSIHRLAHNDGASPALLLSSSASEVLQQFKILKEERKGSIVTYFLKSRDRRPAYQQLSLSFHEQQIDRLSFVDRLGQKSTIQFSKVIYNRLFQRKFLD